MEAGYLLALTTGLTGGFGHCIGMCGPLVTMTALHSAQARPARSPASNIILQVLYHAGRITTYMIVGGLMGLAGSFVNVAGRIVGIQHGVMILAGLVMIVMGLGVAGILGNTKWIERHNSTVLRAARKMIAGSSTARLYPFGLLMGLLPCGLSYTVFIAAAGTGSPAGGAITLLAFGAGTVPALLLFGATVTWLGSKARVAVQKTGGVLVTIMGLYYIAKGIQLYVEM